jgi:MFS family permease
MSPVRARRLLYVSGFIRAMAASTAGVTMGGLLGKLNAHGTELGLVVSAGLAGAAVSAVVATFAADRLGRVRSLVAVSILGMSEPRRSPATP